MAPPIPPVPLKDHCSIIHNNTLYVYSPTAFLTLTLQPNTQWKEDTNGVAVTGATCVKGGIDGDNSRAALYVVGGASNSSTRSYPGLQRYDFEQKEWQTITPIVPVTQNRLHHGVAYMNASSSIVIYAGSQDPDWTGSSTETFLIEMYPPYRVQAYSSTSPPVRDPTMLSWSYDHAVMFGGGQDNQEVWTFGPAEGWQNLSITLPTPLPDRSVAQSALFTLDDESKVLETFDFSQSTTSVTQLVLLNPGGAAANFNETIGSSTTTTDTSVPTSTTVPKAKRSVVLSNFPPYDSQFAPTGSRSGFSLAQDDSGLITIVGGDAQNSVVIFNGTGDAWVDSNKALAAKPQTTAQSTLHRPTSSATHSQSTPSSTSSSSSSDGLNSKGNGLTVLGAVLGGICGLAAILIILLLWLRSIRRRRAREERNRRRSEFPEDKRRLSGEPNFDDSSMQPFSHAGQPMGRSPVTSVAFDKETMAVYGEQPAEKAMEVRSSSAQGHRPRPEQRGSAFGTGMFKRERSPLSISRPMAPHLGDFKDRPSIELGRATPAGPIAAATAGAVTGAAVGTAVAKGGQGRNPSQRKTDEGWAKYFIAPGKAQPVETRAAVVSQSSASTGKGGGGFWPGSGNAEPKPRNPNMALRDSTGNALQAHSVAAASPSVEHPPARSRTLQVAQGIPAHISSGDSTSSADSAGQEDDDGYEDERIEHAYSSGVPSSVHDNGWTPIGASRWSGRPMRPPSNVSSAYPSGGLPIQTSISHETSATASTGNSSGTKRSSIPSFPMPSNTIRSVKTPPATNPSQVNRTLPIQGQQSQQQPVPRARTRRPQETNSGYFNSVGPGRDGMPTNNNLSWLNLNADGR